MPKQDAITNQREQEILRAVQAAGGSCRIGFLARQLNVSDETIRRNIKSLEASGLVKKVHGGVSLTGLVSVEEPPFLRRMGRNTEIKKALAAHVAKKIENGDSLILDVGSTTAFVARALQHHQNLYVVTNSIAVAHMLTSRNNNRVFLAGGELRALDGAAFGLGAVDFIKQFNVKYAILSATAVNAKHGFMLSDIQEADISCAAMSQAETSIVIADNSKFGMKAPVKVKKLENIDMLVTDMPPDAQVAAMLDENDIEVEVLT